MRTCTCIGTCRGSAGLAEGWQCALESPSKTVGGLSFLIAAYCDASRRLADAVRVTFPIGSWAAKVAPFHFVGKVCGYSEADPSRVQLILEHREPRWFDVADLTPTDEPAWAKE